MSFTTDVCAELSALQIKKTCCRRAAALGIMLGARNTEDGFVSYFHEKGVRELASVMLEKIFRVRCEATDTVRVGRQTYVLSFNSSGISEFLRDVDGNTDEAPHIIAGFRCGGCQAAFLRGVFMGCGSITDPQKAYHLEFAFPTKARADFASKIMTEIIGRPNSIKRGERYCLYYKNNNSILDFLYCVGSNHASLYMANSFIERDIRNNENRATNCVARNISRSVDAAQKHIAAIERLQATKKLDGLPEELRYTARLRMENESASLYELALMHEPPITKSGLNRRLCRIMEAA